MNDEAQQDEQAATEPEVDPSVQQRRADLIEQAREATLERADLAALLDKVAALDEVDLSHHVGELDAVHRALRDALAAAGRDDAPSS